MAPTSNDLGLVNGLALMALAFVRSFTPAAATTIFALGVRNQILKGHLVWLIFLALSVGLVVSSCHLPKEAAGRMTKENVDEED